MVANANENRFVAVNDIMKKKRTTTDYNWAIQQARHTLKEFEKPIYYSIGDYKHAYTNKFAKNLNTGNVDIAKQLIREAEGPGNYVYNTKGYRASGQLSCGPSAETATAKFKRLGHAREHKQVGWDLQKPRDNRMYYIGEGGTNLQKMDRHIKKKQCLL